VGLWLVAELFEDAAVVETYVVVDEAPSSSNWKMLWMSKLTRLVVEPEPCCGHRRGREVVAALACRFLRYAAGTWTPGGAGFSTAPLRVPSGFPCQCPVFVAVGGGSASRSRLA
jgi:hypothetical protein